MLRSDLEKALKDNASLFLKFGMLFSLAISYVAYMNEYKYDPMMLYLIGREDKLNSDNRVVVNNFQVELAQQIGSLCNLVASSVSQQNEHLRSVEKLCCSFTNIHDKVLKVFPWNELLMWISFNSSGDLVFINLGFRQSWK